MTTKPVVVFDTCTVRGIIHNHEDSVSKLNEVLIFRDKVHFRIGDASLSELAFALIEKRLPWQDWTERVHLIDNILDKDMPVLPGGRELTTLVDPKESVYPPEVGGIEYWKFSWRFLIDSKSEPEIQAGKEYDLSDGRRIRIKATLPMAEAAFDDERTKWARFFDKMKSLCSGQSLTQEEIVGLIRKGLDIDPTKVPLLSSQYDAMVCSLGRFIHLSLNGKEPYNPRSVKRDGDPFDFSLLHALALPARVCTKDKKFKNHVDLSGTTQKDLLLLPDQLIGWLKSL